MVLMTDRRKWCCRSSAQSPAFRLKLIRNPDNRGFCAANNQGFAASTSEFVALLNNDAEAEPDWLAALGGRVRRRARNRNGGFEDPGLRGSAAHRQGRPPDLSGRPESRDEAVARLDTGQYDRIEEVLWPDGCAAMYRRAMLDQIGGFDEDFFAYADDAELGLRARIAGWKCLYIPHAVVRHHRGATLGVRSSRRLELIERNRVLLAVKLFPWSLLVAERRLLPDAIGGGPCGRRRGTGAKWADTRAFRGKLRSGAGAGEGRFRSADADAADAREAPPA